MKRVLVIGCSGAGKSTFAVALAGRTRLPLIHLDREFWQPGWRPLPRAPWRARLAQLLEEPTWIMDGNFDSSLDIRLPRADTVIWFDLPRSLCLRRVLRRVFTTYGRVRSDMGPGCPERFDLAFLHWIWRFERVERPRIAAVLATHGAHLTPVVFRRDHDAGAFLDALPSCSIQP